MRQDKEDDLGNGSEDYSQSETTVKNKEIRGYKTCDKQRLERIRNKSEEQRNMCLEDMRQRGSKRIKKKLKNDELCG